MFRDDDFGDWDWLYGKEEKGEGSNSNQLMKFLMQRKV